MNLNLTAEDFIKAIEEVEKIIPEKPTITVKNATVTGVKLNSKIIDSIPKAKEPVINFYEGLKVYQDDSVKKPQFFVEGEIEPKKKILKWEDLKFTTKIKTLWVKLGDNTYKMQYYKWDEFTNKVVIFSYQFIEIYDIRFFNDLKLEVIEND